MPNYRNIETGALDIEDWEIAFEPYGEDSGAALTLSFNLMVLKARTDFCRCLHGEADNFLTMWNEVQID